MQNLKNDNLFENRVIFVDYVDEIKKSFYKVFPNGYIYANIDKIIGSAHLYIEFRLVGNKEDLINRIVDNDIMHHKLMGHFRNEDYFAVHSLDDNIELVTLTSGINLKPAKDSFYAMERLKTSFRKSTTTIDKQIPKLKKYFSKLGKLVLENKDNLYQKDLKDKYLVINP